MSIPAADALMEIFGFKRVAGDEITLDNPPSLDDDSGSLNEGIEMGRTEELIRVLNAGVVERDARIATQEAQIKALQSGENSWQSGYDQGRLMGAKHCTGTIDQLRAELAEAKETISRYETTAENCDVLRAELANQLEVKAFWIGRTRALEVELAAIKAQEPVDGALLDYCEECSHPEFGIGYFFTDDCVRQLYSAPVAKQVVMPERIQQALDFARNFAVSKPNIGLTEKQHILGLARLLEDVAHLNAADQEGGQDE